MNDSPRAAADPTDAESLRAEADWLHVNLFGGPIEQRLADRYVAAHQHLELRSGVDVERIVARRLDAEAIEFYARRRNPANPLTQKLRTLLYLAEIEARYYRHFVRHEGSFWSSLPVLVWSPFRSAFKLLKGRFQARRHHVV
ncbi:MAG: hypothetical protein ACE37K_21325 [Planctomycetota bacterium]